MAVTLHPPAPVALRRRRSFPTTVVETLLALTIATAAVSTAVGAVVGRDHGAASDATSIDTAAASSGSSGSSGPSLDDRDRAALGLADGIRDFFGPGAAAAVVDRLTAEVTADGGRVTQLRLYPDRAVATAHERGAGASVADTGDVLVDYAWMAGGPTVGSSRRDLRGTSEFLAFDPADVAWDRLDDLVGEAPVLAGLDDGIVTHVTVDRSTLDPALPLTIRIHVNGERRGRPANRVVELSATGDLLRVA